MKLFNLDPKTLLAVGALIALLALGLMIPQCHAADAPPVTVQMKPIPVYIPFAVYYTDGKFVSVKMFDDQRFDSLQECTEAVQHALLGVMQSGKAPAGGTMKGSCLPVPAHDFATSAM